MGSSHWFDLDGKAESGLLPVERGRGNNDLSSAGHVLAQFWKRHACAGHLSISGLQLAKLLPEDWYHSSIASLRFLPPTITFSQSLWIRTKLIKSHHWAYISSGGRVGGLLPEKMGGVCDPNPKIFTLLMSYLRLKSGIFPPSFMTWPKIQYPV